MKALQAEPVSSIEIVQVTPKMAEKWLEGNVHNRPVRDEIVDKYAEEMKEGRWRLTHQGIAFDDKGVLIDGQHRLFAVWRSGVTVPMVVTRGLPREAQYAIDMGYVRPVHQTLTLMDVSLPGKTGTTKLHAAIVRWLVVGLVRDTRHRILSPLATKDGIRKYGEGVNFALERLGGPRHRLLSASVYGAVARAYYSADRERLAWFCHVYRSGECSNAEDNAAIRLRETMLTMASQGSQAARTRYAKTERALRAFLDHDPIRNIYATEVEMFPLPDRPDEQEQVAPRIDRLRRRRETDRARGRA